MHIVNEVRWPDAGRHLGIGTYGFTTTQRFSPVPFLLTRPIAPHREDVGRERIGFRIKRDLPGLSSGATTVR